MASTPQRTYPELFQLPTDPDSVSEVSQASRRQVPPHVLRTSHPEELNLRRIAASGEYQLQQPYLFRQAAGNTAENKRPEVASAGGATGAGAAVVASAPAARAVPGSSEEEEILTDSDVLRVGSSSSKCGSSEEAGHGVGGRPLQLADAGTGRRRLNDVPAYYDPALGNGHDDGGSRTGESAPADAAPGPRKDQTAAAVGGGTATGSDSKVASGTDSGVVLRKAHPRSGVYLLHSLIAAFANGSRHDINLNIPRLVEIINKVHPAGVTLDSCANSGMTPLFAAIRYGAELDTVRYLLAANADVNWKRRHDGCTPLHQAMRSRRWKMVPILVEEFNADISARTSGEQVTPFFELCQYADELSPAWKIAEIVRAAEAFCGSSRNKGKGVGSVEAARQNKSKAVKIVNEKNLDGLTCLMCACKAGNLALVQFLVKNGAYLCDKKCMGVCEVSWHRPAVDTLHNSANGYCSGNSNGQKVHAFLHHVGCK